MVQFGVSRAETRELDNRYIYAQRCPDLEVGRKTEVWDIVNRRSEEPLARIQWYGPWRQYVMEPEPQTVWNDGCLVSVLTFLRQLNSKQRG